MNSVLDLQSVPQDAGNNIAVSLAASKGKKKKMNWTPLIGVNPIEGFSYVFFSTNKT